ncbi:DUF881 domain-containing protein [Dactylosporangium sp. NPDC049525]|uniref:DUF881 domain-containing protein n=1 Tax=Dactylosporangium sp. NPDC049525 TaxID=3154730 RepID=UPI00343542DC
MTATPPPDDPTAPNGADVSGADGAGADVSDAGADVSDAGADVSDAGADVSDAGADVSGADLSGADGADADADGPDVSDVGTSANVVATDSAATHVGERRSSEATSPRRRPPSPRPLPRSGDISEMSGMTKGVKEAAERGRTEAGRTEDAEAGRTEGRAEPTSPELTSPEPAGRDTADDAADDSGGDAGAGDAAPPARGGKQRGGTGLVIALLVALLGFAISVQFKASNSDAELAAARPEDLVRILSDLDAQQDRLRREISDLEDTRRQLDSGAQGRDAALAEARKRADELGILAGTLPAEGPGLSIEITPGTEKVKAEVILDAVEELRGAGAEAMQINGHDGGTVRVVAATYFVDGDNDRLVVAGLSLAAPYTIMVIGGPDTMRTALNIPGGVVDSVRQHGGTVLVREADPVRVTALHTAGELKYAKPA